MLAITISNTTFTMEYIKSFFISNTVNEPPKELKKSNKPSQKELRKINKQLQELEKIQEVLIPAIEAAIRAHARNTEKLNCNKENNVFSGIGIGDRWIARNIQGIEFVLREKNDIIYFNIKNLLDKCVLLDEFTIDKTISFNLLYSHLLDFFDAVINKLDGSEKGGFVKILLDPKTAIQSPRTVDKLKPKPIVPSKSLKEAIERLDRVIKNIAEKIFQRIQQIDDSMPIESSTQN